MTIIAIGRLLRASTTGCVVGCRVSQLDAPAFGSLVRIPLENGPLQSGPLPGGSPQGGSPQGGYQIYGLIYDIYIDDDGLVRQLVTAEGIDEAVILDNRHNRNVPAEVGVLAVGYRQNSQIYHLLPPRPPLSLDMIYLCDADELCGFTEAGRFGYFRHILRSTEAPAAELLAAHLQECQRAHAAAGHPDWIQTATRELITLLRDDYPTLMGVLSALSDIRELYA